MPIPTRELLDFFGHRCKLATDQKAALVNGDTLEDILKRYENAPDPYSVSVVVGNHSALINLYTRAYLTMDGDLNKRLNTLLDGYEKSYLKKNCLMKISEGPDHMPHGSSAGTLDSSAMDRYLGMGFGDNPDARAMTASV